MICTKSPLKNDVIPLKVIFSSNSAIFLARVVVTAPPTIGDWITLSIAIIAFAFWLCDVKEWEVPTPTALISKTSGVVSNALVELAASLILFSSTLTAYTVAGNLVVLPYPAIVEVPIPIAWVVPDPA